MNRRGFTLTEVLIGLVLAAALGGVIIKTMTSMQRFTGTQSARVDSQESMRAAAYYLTSTLRELDAAEGDVISATATTLRFRANRWTGLSCSAIAASAPNVTVTVKRSQLFGVRAPSATLDSLLVFNEVTTASRSDDVWMLGKLVDTSAVNCADGTSGLRLTMLISAASGGNAAALAGFTLGSPIRGFQMEELSLYTDAAGAYWFGQSTADLSGAWSAVTPLAGPLTSSGISFTYFDTLNTATATKTAIASVGVVVRSQSQKLGRGASGNTNLRDSLVTRIALRNNKRF